MISNDELDYLQKAEEIKNTGQAIWQHYMQHLYVKYKLIPGQHVINSATGEVKLANQREVSSIDSELETNTNGKVGSGSQGNPEKLGAESH